jgi:hypothetical protein
MQDCDKFRSDLEDWEKRTNSDKEGPRMESLRRLFFRCLRGIPDEVLAGLFLTFQDKYLREGEDSRLNAREWLGGTVSLLLGEYDGTPFTQEEWRDIRETVNAGAGEIDLDLLTQIMELVMEHDALD